MTASRVTAVALGLAGLGLYFWFRLPTPEGVPVEEPSAAGASLTEDSSRTKVGGSAAAHSGQTTSALGASSQAVPAAASVGTAEPSALPARPLDQQMPTLKEIRREVKRDAHQTPLPLVRFSTAVAGRIDAAKANASARQPLFDELRRCAEKSELMVMRRYCYASARELAEKKFPDLRTEANLKWIEAMEPQLKVR